MADFSIIWIRSKLALGRGDRPAQIEVFACPHPPFGLEDKHFPYRPALSQTPGPCFRLWLQDLSISSRSSFSDSLPASPKTRCCPTGGRPAARRYPFAVRCAAKSRCVLPPPCHVVAPAAPARSEASLSPSCALTGWRRGAAVRPPDHVFTSQRPVLPPLHSCT